MIKKVIIIISVILILTLIYETGVNGVVAEKSEPGVLMISSYSPSVMTFFHLIDGVKSVLDSLDVTLDIEFMDSKRFDTEENLNNFSDSLSYKLSNQSPYDVIIISEDNAFNFVLGIRKKCFLIYQLYSQGLMIFSMSIGWFGFFDNKRNRVLFN